METNVCCCSMAGSVFCRTQCSSRPKTADASDYRCRPPAYPTYPEPHYPWNPEPKPPVMPFVTVPIDYEKLAEEIVKRLKKDGNLHERV
jgi:hypothetical protein